MLPRKASCGDILAPVPQTDSGGREENSQALERTLVKELRHNDTVTSGEGVPVRVMDLASAARSGRREMAVATVY